jgi:hypothetical protein
MGIYDFGKIIKWYTRVISNGGPSNDEELDSECEDELNSNNKST